jgi:hypothetical protein
MKQSVRFLVLATAGAGWLFAGPVGLQFNPASQAVLTGQSVSADVMITGLGLPPEVGSFDLSIAFDPSLLSPVSISFGLLLGNPLFFEALTDSFFVGNIANAAEVSLLSNAQLDALQSSSFSLFTMNFTALRNGTATFTYAGGPVDDGNGQLIFGSKVPEPEPGFLLVTGLVCLPLLELLRALGDSQEKRSSTR